MCVNRVTFDRSVVVKMGRYTFNNKCWVDFSICSIIYLPTQLLALHFIYSIGIYLHIIYKYNTRKCYSILITELNYSLTKPTPDVAETVMCRVR